MANRAKRFYLCNLIPLWEIDESDMDVDWPVHHAFFNDLIDMKADIRKRPINIHANGDPKTPHPDLKIRFEVYESDFLLSGGLNDKMGIFSSHADYGDSPSVRPLKIVSDVDNVPENEREQFIFIEWQDEQDLTINGVDADGNPTTQNIHRQPGLRVRCFWKVTDQEGGDVSGNPEFFYDVFVDGKLTDGKDLSLHERSDNELVGWSWNVTDKPRKGRLSPLVDGEYAMLKMLQLIDSAQFSIHVLNWKLDPQATLMVSPVFQGDYTQVPGLDPASYEALLVHCKPQVLGVSIKDGVIMYSAINGNVVVAKSDGTLIQPAVQQIDMPTNLDVPAGIQFLDSGGGGGINALVLDQLRGRLFLYVVVPKAGLNLAAPGVFAAVFPNQAYTFFQCEPTLELVMADPKLIAGLIPLAGSGYPDGHPGYKDGGLAYVDAKSKVVTPTGKMNHPTGLLVVNKNIYITDTGNNCLRIIRNFDPSDITTALSNSSFNLETFAGLTEAGNADGAANSARFNSPTGIAWDSKANRIFVADTGNHLIREVNPTTGTVKTLNIAKIDGAATKLGEVHGLAFKDTGTSTLFVTERDKHRILAVDLATLEATTFAGSTSGEATWKDGPRLDARFKGPLDLAVEGTTLCVADSDNRVVRVIDLVNDEVTTIGSTTKSGPQDVPVLIGNQLGRKASEGVTVRVLMDALGSGFEHDAYSLDLSFGIDGPQTVADLRFYNNNVEAFVQNHPQSVFGHTTATYHEKMMVVDGKHGTIGGIDYASDKNDGLIHNRFHRNSLFWHDVITLVEGPAALGLEELFVRRWMLAREEYDKKTPQPEVLQPIDRTDSTIQDADIEAVRTFDPTPLFGFLPHLISDEVTEVLKSYERAIKSARHYVYLEHQYIYSPEIGDYVAEAMKDNPKLQVIFTIPFFTEESKDPTSEKAQLEANHQLATNLFNASQFFKGGQKQQQMSWHGFYNLSNMVKKFREIDPNRFGLFSIQQLYPNWQDPTNIEMKMIYLHSKLILCDDRFLSIGSANANGRGFTKDGEANVSSLDPVAGKVLRDRLWGEHLGYMGTAVCLDDGSLVSVNGHHLTPGAKIRLRHPDLGNAEVEREVDVITPDSGAIILKGAPFDTALHGQRLLWRDPTLDDLPLGGALDFWRRSAHGLNVTHVVQGAHATTDASGNLVVAKNKAASGDRVFFGEHILLLDDEGNPTTSSSAIPRPFVAGNMEVVSVSGDTITLKPIADTVPDSDAIKSVSLGGTINQPPFVIKVVSRSGGDANIEKTLMPNQKEVHFDYTASWLRRQPGADQGVRAWEIDPPEGMKYNGPGSVIFSPWWIIPWFFIDFNPDEQARLELPAGNTRLV